MNNTLYIQIDANIEVSHPHVYLQDIAKLICTNQQIVNRIRVMPVVDFSKRNEKQYILSILDLTCQLLEKEPNLQIESLGEENFIITYKPRTPAAIIQWIKVFFVCCAAFFGSAFSIMTFNKDADVGNLFLQIYTQITGETSSGFTILEISYSIGIGIGVLFFFNHFGRKKFSTDPTPLQVQMSLYENDINNTIIKNVSRSKKSDS